MRQLSTEEKDRKNWAHQPTLKDKIAFLSDSGAYGPTVKAVEIRETNMSWVFIAGDLVFKLKKPVRFSYLDFSTLAKRHDACQAEVELNRRLAPSVYLGCVPLTYSGRRLAIDGEGDAVDWLVKMRRLDESRMLDKLLANKAMNEQDAAALAARLAAFYRTAVPVSLSPRSFLRQWNAKLRQNSPLLFDERFRLPRKIIGSIVSVLQEFLEKRKALLLERLRARWIVDGHGDLRPEHIWIGDEIKIIDCLEFNASLRAVDPLEELAYLALECEHLGARNFGDLVRTRVQRALGDHPPLELFYFYHCYRAMLRARLSIAHLLNPHPRTPRKWRPQAIAYLRIAQADARKLDGALRRQADRRAACLREAVR